MKNEISSEKVLTNRTFRKGFREKSALGAALLAISDCQNLRCRRTVERPGLGGVHTEQWIAMDIENLTQPFTRDMYPPLNLLARNFVRNRSLGNGVKFNVMHEA